MKKIEDIGAQRAAAESEVAAAEQALEQAERAYDLEPSQSKRQQVRERQEELAEARLSVERVQRLEDAAAKAQADADRQATMQEIARLEELLKEPQIVAAVAPLIEREKIARLELMQVSLEAQRFAGELRERCYTLAQLKEKFSPSRDGEHPNTQASRHYHSVADTFSVLWADRVNAALEQSANLTNDVSQHDPRRVALRGVQI